MIRIAKETDSPALAAIYGWYVENTAVSFEYEAPTAEEFAGRIREILLIHPFWFTKRKERFWALLMPIL